MCPGGACGDCRDRRHRQQQQHDGASAHNSDTAAWLRPAWHGARDVGYGGLAACLCPYRECVQAPNAAPLKRPVGDAGLAGIDVVPANHRAAEQQPRQGVVAVRSLLAVRSVAMWHVQNGRVALAVERVLVLCRIRTQRPTPTLPRGIFNTEIALRHLALLPPHLHLPHLHPVHPSTYSCA